MKNTKSYLHIYLGCKIRMLHKATNELSSPKELTPNVLSQILMYDGGVNFAYQLLLRPLSDMTEEEAAEVWRLFGWNERIKNFQERMMNIIWEFEPPNEEIEPYWEYGQWKYLLNALPYLLSRGFDLFRLIEDGLAINACELRTVS